MQSAFDLRKLSIWNEKQLVGSLWYERELLSHKRSKQTEILNDKDYRDIKTKSF